MHSIVGVQRLSCRVTSRHLSQSFSISYRASPSLRASLFQSARHKPQKIQLSGTKPVHYFGDLLKSILQDPSLPPLPKKPTSSLPRALTSDEIQLYLTPLYTRCWDIRFAPHAHNRICTEKPAWLGRKYTLKAPRNAFAFARKLLTLAVEEKHSPTKLVVAGCIVELQTNTGRLNTHPVLTLNDVRLAMLSDEIFAQEIADGTAPIPKQVNLALKASSIALHCTPFPNVVDQSADSTSVESNTPLPPIPSLSDATLPNDLESIDDTDLKKYMLPLYSRNWAFRPSRVYVDKILRLSIILEPKMDGGGNFFSAVALLDALTEFGSSGNPIFTLIYESTVNLFIENDSKRPLLPTHADLREAIRLEAILDNHAKSFVRGPLRKSARRPHSITVFDNRSASMRSRWVG